MGWLHSRGLLIHLGGSAHTPEDVEILKAVAKQRPTEGQDKLDFGARATQGAGVDDPRFPRRAPVGGVVSWISGGGFGWHQRRRGGVQAVGAGQDHRADQQA